MRLRIRGGDGIPARVLLRSRRLSRNNIIACAIILPFGLEYNAPVAGKRYRAIGKAMGVDSIDLMDDDTA